MYEVLGVGFKEEEDVVLLEVDLNRAVPKAFEKMVEFSSNNEVRNKKRICRYARGQDIDEEEGIFSN
ncbi:hypothetical protein PIB30_033209 [Stylosanthes scabra]|uniref:Uncharacterized protein n=1 Tax=Stylosanthes scabra TaxID=79078 RepID=A0ABU6SC99_9FABA|nr:hypothetical protein [Stylosanthes scabra]